MTPVWVADLVDHFWRAVGPPPPCPRDLHPAVTVYGPTVVRRPALTLATVRGYLARYGLEVASGVPDRQLRACLFAHAGWGFVFLDLTDTVAEQRFSLAHELAYFLRDADAPRRKLAAALGPEAVRLLDGAPPTTDQRIVAMLPGVPLAAHVHLMSRDDTGVPKTPAERESEAAADRLGAELLAPATLFDNQPTKVICQRLETEFGLPYSAAATYAAILRPLVWRDPLLARLA